MAELLFKVAADTGSAASSLRRLLSPLTSIGKQSEAASKSLNKLGKADVTPTVNTTGLAKAITTAEKKLADLQAQLVEDVTLGVDTKATQAAIRKVEGDLRTLRKAGAKPVPVTVDTKGVVAAFDRARASRDRFVQSLKDKTGVTALSGIKSSLGDIGGALSSAGGRIQGFFGGIGKVASGLGPVVSGLAVGLVGVAAGAVAAGVSVLKAADQFENAKIGFTTLLGSGQKAQKFLVSLQKFAAKTPFSFTGLTDAASQLLSYGFAAKDVTKVLTVIGDAAQGNEAKVASLTQTLGKMQATGKIGLEDINELITAGVDAWGLLEEATGKNRKQLQKLVSEGKLGQDTIDKFLVATGKKYAGGMEKAAETISGLISTLQDTWDQTKVKIGTAIAPFAKVGLKIVQANLEKAADRLIAGIPTLITNMRTLALALVDLPATLAAAFGSLLAAIIAAFSGLQSALGQVLTSIGDILTSIGQILQVLGFLNPAFVGLGDSMAQAGKDAKAAGEDLGKASVATGRKAEEVKRFWDDWATNYTKGAKKTRDAIEAAAAQGALVFSTGKAQTEVDKLTKAWKKAKDRVEKNPTKVNIEAEDKAKEKLDAAEKRLKALAKYEAHPKLLAEDLASGKVKIVNGVLQVLTTKEWKAKLDADKTKFDREHAAADAQLQAWGKAHETASLDAEGSGVTKATKAAERKVIQFGKEKATASLFANNSNVNRETDQASGWVNSFGDKSATATLKVDNSQALREITQAQNAVNAFHGKTVTVRARREEVSVASAPSPAVAATAGPTVEIHVRDEVLAALIDLRVNGQAVQAARVLRRRDLVTL